MQKRKKYSPKRIIGKKQPLTKNLKKGSWKMRATRLEHRRVGGLR